MKRNSLIGAIFIMAIVLPATYMLVGQFSSGDLIQVDLTLKLKSTSNAMEYVAAYHWAGGEIDSSISSNNVKWDTRTALANVKSSNELTNAVRNTFSKIEITNDWFAISPNGNWNLNLHDQLCSGVVMNVVVNGNDTKVESFTPSLSVEFMPPELASALQKIGINSLDAVVTLSVNIIGKVIEQFFENCFQVAKSYAHLVKELLNYNIGTLYAS